MRGGDLRHRLTFQTFTQAKNTATGALVETWANTFTCWGSISPLSGRELVAGQAVQSSISHTIIVRYRSEFAIPKAVAAMRIVYGSRVFNAKASLNTDERKQMVTIMAEEGLTNGD